MNVSLHAGSAQTSENCWVLISTFLTSQVRSERRDLAGEESGKLFFPFPHREMEVSTERTLQGRASRSRRSRAVPHLREEARRVCAQHQPARLPHPLRDRCEQAGYAKPTAVWVFEEAASLSKVIMNEILNTLSRLYR